MSEVALRVGVVGCGAVTERYHLPALLASRDVEVVALVDPVVDRARALGARVGLPRAMVLPSYEGLVGNIDLALVAVPNAYHESVTVALLRSGVHVLVEKPMARSTAECDRMLSAASNGTVLAVGHDFRYFPVAQFARALFTSGLLGALRRVDLRQRAGGRWPFASTAALSPSAGGGALIDFGVHLFDLLLWWFGDLRAIEYRDDAMGGVESECECVLELQNGAPVHFELSRSRRLRDTLIVEGERGTIELGVFEPAVVRLAVPGGPMMVGGVPDEIFADAPLATVFARQLADVVAAVRGRGMPLVGGEDGRRAVALVEACYALKEPLRHSWDYPNAYETLARHRSAHGPEESYRARGAVQSDAAR